MLLAVDIGNTNIKFGVFDDEKLVSKFVVPTASPQDELESAFTNLRHPVNDAIVCSVVPAVTEDLIGIIRRQINQEPVIVTNAFDFGMKVHYEPLSAAGADRLVNAFAAMKKYGVPCIVCSFGTATTIDVVNSEGDLLGGLIAPGFLTMAKALHKNTSRLPEVDVKKPESVIGYTTVGAIRSGIFFSQLGLVESAIVRIATELGTWPTVVATGGFASDIAGGSDVIDVVDEMLTLDGLRRLFSRKKK